MSNKKVVAVCGPGELFGGVERWIETYAEYLKNAPTFSCKIFLFWDGELARKLRDKHIEPVIISNPTKNPFSLIHTIKQSFITHAIDIVHTHGYKADILCGMAAKDLHIPVVKTQHGMIETYKGLNRSSLKLFLNISVSRWIERSFKTVVFVTEDLLTKRRKKDKRFCVVHNGIAPIDLSVQKNQDDACSVLIVGRISPVKGHDVLFRALQNLAGSRIQLTIAGSGSLEAKYKEMAQRFGISDRVHFVGFRSDIYELIAQSDILVMPSLHEGLPYTLLEAMYLKTAVIASDVGGLKEILEDGVDALLVPSGDDHGLTKAFLRLEHDTELRQKLAESAYQKCKKYFMIDTMAQKYFDVYNEISEK